jgi:hypothetical protein
MWRWSVFLPIYIYVPTPWAKHTKTIVIGARNLANLSCSKLDIFLLLMSPPTILVRQAVHVVHDGHRPGLLTSWLRWKRHRHLATAANRRVSCALQRRNERLHQPSSFSFRLFCVSIVGENSRLGMLFFHPSVIYICSWSCFEFSVGRASPKRALSSSRTYSCVERRRVPSACYHRPPPTMQAQLPYVPHPSLLLKLRISSCRWEPLTVRLVAVFLLLSYACLPLTQLVSYYCCRPPHPWPRVLAVFVDVRHQLHAVVCPSMVSKRSYLRCKTDQIAITQ